MTLNILFCGLGSIGKRHARLLKQNFGHEIFAFRTFKGQEKNDLGIPEFSSWKEVESRSFDVAFITNPTNLHITSAVECAQRGMNLFIEKPIGSQLDGLDKLLEIVDFNRLTAYVAYPLRFHPVLKELKSLLRNKRILHTRIVCESYLPDWRPGQDHLKSYSSFKEMGGGVILDLSHEIDYVSYLFGEIESITGKHGKLNNITVDSEDYADMIISHRASITNIHLNYFSKNPQRIIEIKTDEDFLRADLINNSIVYIGKNEQWKKEVEIKRDDMYVAQLDYFFANISNRKLDNNIFEASRLFRKVLAFRNNI